MAAGPMTRVADVVVPQIFTPYVQQLTEQKARIIQSGLAVRDAAMDNLLTGGGLTFNVPSFRDLDNDADRVSTDTSTPFASADASLPAGVARPPDPLKIQTSQEVAVRLNRNNSWSSSDLAASLAGRDPMEAIADRVAYYWTRRLQAAFIATWNGVIANNVASFSSDYVNNISGAAFLDGVTNFSAEAFLDAALTMGDSMEDLTAVVAHSVVYNRMQKNNLIDVIPDSEGRVNIPTFLGREVIVDDNVPRVGNVYDTWLFGGGSTRLGVGTPKVPTEVERRPGGGNGGGQEVLYSRVEWTVHPVGHAFIGVAPSGGPSNTGTAGADLDEAASWNRVYPERKQVKFARLVTREA
jgi:hypothetical protein